MAGFLPVHNLGQLDREMRNLGQANLDRVAGAEHWVRLDEALQLDSGDPPGTRYVLWAKHDDRVVYQSPDWPEDLSPEVFPVPAHYESPDAPKPGQPLPPPPRRGEQISPQNPALPRKAAEFYTREAGGKMWRIGVMGNPYVTLILGADIVEFNARMSRLRNTFLATLPVVLLLAAGGTWLVVRRALNPVTTLTRVAESVTAHGLDRRIAAMHRDQEFNRQVTVFNEMLDRLETSFHQTTRFSDDAAHELKTPLARLQIELEQAVESAAAGSPPQAVYSSLLDDISRLRAILQKLLLLALADAGRLQLQLQPVNLSTMLASAVEDSQAQTQALRIEQVIPADIHIQADAELLEQALQNLASNAIEYKCTEEVVRIELAPAADQVVIRVGNPGCLRSSAMACSFRSSPASLLLATSRFVVFRLLRTCLLPILNHAKVVPDST